MSVNRSIKGKGHSQFFFPTFNFGGGDGHQDDSADGYTGGGMAASWAPSAPWAPTAAAPPAPDPWQAYYGNKYEDNDTDTDDDDGEDLDGSDFPGQIGQDDAVIQQYLYQNYVFHKKRWRRFTGRPTRFHRFGKGKSGKGSLIPFRGGGAFGQRGQG